MDPPCCEFIFCVPRDCKSQTGEIRFAFFTAFFSFSIAILISDFSSRDCNETQEEEKKKRCRRAALSAVDVIGLAEHTVAGGPVRHSVRGWYL